VRASRENVETLSTPQYAHRRQNDLMPTQPGRLALAQAENPRLPANNQTAHNNVVVLRNEPENYNNNNVVRNIAPRRYENRNPQVTNSNNRIADRQGNFRNNNPTNSLPRAG